jgi:hypothetical protein
MNAFIDGGGGLVLELGIPQTSGFGRAVVTKAKTGVFR